MIVRIILGFGILLVLTAAQVALQNLLGIKIEGPSFVHRVLWSSVKAMYWSSVFVYLIPWVRGS